MYTHAHTQAYTHIHMCTHNRDQYCASMCGILVLRECNVKFQDFLLCLYRQVCIFQCLACNNIVPYCCVVFLRRGLRNKIIHSTYGHTHLSAVGCGWHDCQNVQERKCADSSRRLSFWYLLASAMICYYTLQPFFS